MYVIGVYMVEFVKDMFMLFFVYIDVFVRNGDFYIVGYVMGMYGNFWFIR